MLCCLGSNDGDEHKEGRENRKVSAGKEKPDSPPAAPTVAFRSTDNSKNSKEGGRTVIQVAPSPQPDPTQQTHTVMVSEQESVAQLPIRGMAEIKVELTEAANDLPLSNTHHRAEGTADEWDSFVKGGFGRIHTVGAMWDVQTAGRIHEASVPDDEGTAVRLLVIAVASEGRVGYVAVSSRCPHYGAPLSKGLVCGSRLICPWHAAGFHLPSGDIEDAPALEPLRTLPARVSPTNNTVQIMLPVPFLAAAWALSPNALPPALAQAQRSAMPHTFNSSSSMSLAVAAPSASASSTRFLPTPVSASSTILLIGGGPASVAAAQALRSGGFSGTIMLCTDEDYPPYDRPKVSKAISINIKNIKLLPDNYYKEYRIDLRLSTRVVDLDTTAKKALLKDGSSIEYDRCLIATGCEVRRLNVPGHDLKNIFYLRDYPDAAAVNEMSLQKSKVVIIGGSFIGMEAASYMRQVRKLPEVTVVSNNKLPFEKIFGPEIAQFMFDLHVSKGVKFKLCRSAKQFLGEAGVVTHVVLDNDEILEAEFVIIGIGSLPATKFVRGLEMEPDGSIQCDLHMKTKDDCVYVAGDIARFNFKGEKIRAEHWDVAIAHGTVAGANMAGNTSAVYKSIPFFWTQQFGQSIRFVGYMSPKIDSHFSIIDAQEKKYATFFCCKDKILALASLNCDPLPIAVSELMRLYKVPKKSDLESMKIQEIIDLASSIAS